MSGTLLLASIMAVFLCGFLFVALLKPEWFS